MYKKLKKMAAPLTLAFALATGTQTAAAEQIGGNEIATWVAVLAMISGGGSKIEAQQNTAPKIGDKMKDGTIYAGVSPDTKKPMYAAPEDVRRLASFNSAKKICDKKGFRLPTKDELNVLWQNRDKGALKGTFNQTESDSSSVGLYFSSAPVNPIHSWSQRFSNGKQFPAFNDDHLSARCVR